VNLAKDMCNSQVSKTYKTCAAELLEILVDHIDGTMTYVIHLAAEAIKFSLKGDDISEIPKKYLALTEIADTVFITNTQPIIRIETAIVVFTALSYNLPQREDLHQIVNQTVMHNLKYFINEKTPCLIRVRVTLFLGEYLHELLRNESNYTTETFREIMNYLIVNLANTNLKEKVMVLQSIESLSSIFMD